MQVRPSSSPQATAAVVTVIALDAGPETQGRYDRIDDRASKELIASDSRLKIGLHFTQSAFHKRIKTELDWTGLGVWLEWVCWLTVVEID